MIGYGTTQADLNTFATSAACFSHTNLELSFPKIYIGIKKRLTLGKGH